jgi:predicted transposase/invertase (TIGR01784 family)
MGQTDIISKSLTRQIVADMATYLLGLDLRSLEEAPTEQQRIEMRHADIVMKAENRDGEKFILHLELQNQNDPNMAQRMLRYYSDITLSYPGMLIRQYVIYIGKAAMNMAVSIEHPEWRYRYQLIDMHQLDCERFIRQGNPDALVMAILCDFKGRESSEVIENIIDHLISMTGADHKALRRYLKMLESLSVNRNLFNEFKQVELKMLSEIDIEKLPSYQIGIDKGIEQGIEQGLEQGIIHEKQAVARAALQQGLKPRLIATLTGLTMEQIQLLK